MECFRGHLWSGVAEAGGRPLYLGVDVGSVSTNLVLMDDGGSVHAEKYLRTYGQPIQAIQEGLRELARDWTGTQIDGVGTTGSARYLAGVIVGADVVKNEITAHAVASLQEIPDVQTVLEIGGQDSKIIILRNGVAVDFAMNTVCAAGTGSFLDQQANRLRIPIEEFGDLAVGSHAPVRIAGRCTVFAESDMIHKQQMGYSREDIVAGLCEAMVRNYLNNLGKGKEILPPVAFQGGVAANKGIRAAFEKELGCPITIPEHYQVMGAVGGALLAKERMEADPYQTAFKGFDLAEWKFQTSGFECDGCSNCCEIVEIREEGKLIARWGDRCGKWQLSEKSEIVEHC